MYKLKCILKYFTKRHYFPFQSITLQSNDCCESQETITRNVFHVIYVVLQLFMTFKYSNVIVNRSKGNTLNKNMTHYHAKFKSLSFQAILFLLFLTMFIPYIPGLVLITPQGWPDLLLCTASDLPFAFGLILSLTKQWTVWWRNLPKSMTLVMTNTRIPTFTRTSIIMMILTLMVNLIVAHFLHLWLLGLYM